MKVAISAVLPVGVPPPLFGETAISRLTGWPWVMDVGLRLEIVVVVGLNTTVFQLFARFATFTDPRPVARS